MPDLHLSKIDLSQDGMSCVLNDLECGIMEFLWNNKESTARTVYDKLKRKDLASTTIVVTLDRLHKKGLVERKVATGRGGLHYIYSPRYTKPVLGERLSLLFAQNMISTFGDSVAANFSQDTLKKLIEKKK